MTRGESYRTLALLLEYPEQREELLAGVDQIERHLEGSGWGSLLAPFASFVAGGTLAALQEDYVATFDFDPARAPYLGHHLYGDPGKRAQLMIRLREAFVRFGFPPEGCELPDHLTVLLKFLAHLDDSCGAGSREDRAEFRRRLVVEEVLPGVRKLSGGEKQGSDHWRALFAAAELLLGSDCEEVSA